MAKLHLLQLSCVLIASLAIFSFAEDDRQVYIVYMGNVPETTTQSLSSLHLNMLQEVVDSRFVEKSLVRSYTRSFNGFAAYLTPQERQKLDGHDEVVSIFPKTYYQLHTTRSWDFLGLPEKVHRNPTVESDTIVGVIDTGISPESKSFNDKGFGPPPKKWKGVCKGGANFTCNNKLIGARFYTEEKTARDTQGHGTHTASTAAGNHVRDASFNGIAKGTARGGVPSARIAAYAVCSVKNGCGSDGILAAFDDAVADGVDVISISLGYTFFSVALPLNYDVISIGAFHATQNGVLVVQSAGNSATEGSIASIAPWIFSIAASTTDRGIVSKVVVREGTEFIGKAVNSFKLAKDGAPVVYGGKISHNCSYKDAFACKQGCVEPKLVKGKIVLCNRYFGMTAARIAGAIGVVTTNVDDFLDYAVDYAEVVQLAATSLNSTDFNALISYLNSTKSRKLNILASISVKNLDAPRVANFSSRGPNILIPNILKPDITAPGVEILAAYSPSVSPLLDPNNKTSAKYSVLSGTSMSCPHAAGAAAYVKSFHPSWSPASIKSALMTTATRLDSTKDPLAEFSYGAGQIDPVKAVDPGLVYDITVEDYIQLLCSLGYNTTIVRKITKLNTTCPNRPQRTHQDLNYPTMTRGINTTSQGSGRSFTFSEQFTRRVTNVGHGNSTYKVTTSNSTEYKILVKPDVLKFGAVNETKTFTVSISGKTSKEIVSAWLEWSHGMHAVRSPIVIYRRHSK